MQVIIDWIKRVFWQDPQACFQQMDGVSDLVGCLNVIVWSDALIYLALGAGLFYSILTRFVQVRMFREMIRLLFSSKESDRGISSFQALAVSLSGRVGTGNIAGVAAAIGFGGPGAVFWMWMVAFLGSATAYIESALGQIYKEEDEDGQYRGGPAYYIEKAMGQKWYAWIFAIATIFACGVLLPGVQSNSIGNASNLAVGGETVAVLGFIIFGGVKRIAHVTQVIVPLMALGYILMAVGIILYHIADLPAIIALIIGDAFSPMAGVGAAIGASNAAFTRTKPDKAADRMPPPPPRYNIRRNRDSCSHSPCMWTRCLSARRPRS
jgi:AGCS family alanine or glycine:cation symporter